MIMGIGKLAINFRRNMSSVWMCVLNIHIHVDAVCKTEKTSFPVQHERQSVYISPKSIHLLQYILNVTFLYDLGCCLNI